MAKKLIDGIEYEIIGKDKYELWDIAEMYTDDKSITVKIKPEYDEMSLEELQEYFDKVEDVYLQLEANEPEDEESEEYAEWEREYEDVEDLMNAVEDILYERQMQ